MSSVRLRTQSGKLLVLSVGGAAFGWMISAWVHSVRSAPADPVAVVNEHEPDRTFDVHEAHGSQDHGSLNQRESHRLPASLAHLPRAPVNPAPTVADVTPSSSDLPTQDEIDGQLNELYATWSRAPRDSAQTSEARARVERVLAEYAIDPLSREISCTEHLCRIRLLFRTRDDLSRLGRVRYRPKGLVVGRPQGLREGTAVVIYSQTNEDALRPSLQTREDPVGSAVTATDVAVR